MLVTLRTLAFHDDHAVAGFLVEEEHKDDVEVEITVDLFVEDGSRIRKNETRLTEEVFREMAEWGRGVTVAAQVSLTRRDGEISHG